MNQCRLAKAVGGTPTTEGKLADIDPALIMTPPAGLEVGYVPIVTKQASRNF